MDDERTKITRVGTNRLGEDQGGTCIYTPPPPPPITVCGLYTFVYDLTHTF